MSENIKSPGNSMSCLGKKLTCPHGNRVSEGKGKSEFQFSFMVSQLSILNLNRLDKANGEIEFLKVAREKAEDDIARFRNELSSLTEARNKHVMEQERQNSEMHMLQNDIKVRILCLQFSLNPLKFSFKRETDKKMTRAKS